MESLRRQVAGGILSVKWAHVLGRMAVGGRYANAQPAQRVARLRGGASGVCSAEGWGVESLRMRGCSIQRDSSYLAASQTVHSRIIRVKKYPHCSGREANLTIQDRLDRCPNGGAGGAGASNLARHTPSPCAGGREAGGRVFTPHCEAGVVG